MTLVRLWSPDDGAAIACHHWGLKQDIISHRCWPNLSQAWATESACVNLPLGLRLLQRQGPGGRSRVTSQGWWGRWAGGQSHISACCSLIPTALYYNAQMDADMEPSTSHLRTVPPCNLPVWQCVCGLQWLHARATCRHHELLQTRAPHQELRLHGGRRCAYPTAVQPHAVVPDNRRQRQHQWDARSHRLLQ